MASQKKQKKQKKQTHSAELRALTAAALHNAMWVEILLGSTFTAFNL